MIRVETSAPQPARWHRQSTHRMILSDLDMLCTRDGGRYMADSVTLTVEAE